MVGVICVLELFILSRTIYSGVFLLTHMFDCLELMFWLAV